MIRELQPEQRSAVMSPCGLYRYELRRVWDPEGTIACWIMLNQSTADALTDDPTIRRVRGFSRAWGHGGLVVVNLFALRASDPRKLHVAIDAEGPENMLHMARALECASVVVAAWGAHPLARRRGEVFLWKMRALNCEPPYCLGRSLDGAPRHPLYVSASAAPERMW